MSSVCVSPLRGAALSALCLILVACGGEPSSPEQRVRTLIEGVQQSVEVGSVRQLQGVLHEGYSDPRHASRAAALRALFGILQRHRGVHLFTVIETVSLGAGRDSADVVVYVGMAGVPVESMEALVSLNADLYRFEIGLVEENDEWRILSSRWARVEPGAF